MNGFVLRTPPIPTIQGQQYRTMISSSTFCFFPFDLRESLEDNVFSQGNSKDLIVEADVGNVLGGANNFELFIFIVSERNLILDIANKKMIVQVL